jgi:uncharacterized protein (DUF488 family)
MTKPFYTIGHATRPISEFVELLQSAEVQLVIDVRAMPRSKKNPQYNRDILLESLKAFRIEYEHFAELGGLRGKNRWIPASVNAFWKNESFHNYADYAMGEEFRAGLIRLRKQGRTRCCAIMCAETVWWRCHRRIIADYLLAAGESVFHIVEARRTEPAQLTRGLQLSPSGICTYPASA